MCVARYRVPQKGEDEGGVPSWSNGDVRKASLLSFAPKDFQVPSMRWLLCWESPSHHAGVGSSYCQLGDTSLTKPAQSTGS